MAKKSKKLKKKLKIQELQAIIGTGVEGVTGQPNAAKEALGEQIAATSLDLQDAEEKEAEGGFLDEALGFVGGVAGQALIPIPGVGAAIGSTVGSVAGKGIQGEEIDLGEELRRGAVGAAASVGSQFIAPVLPAVAPLPEAGVAQSAAEATAKTVAQAGQSRFIEPAQTPLPVESPQGITGRTSPSVPEDAIDKVVRNPPSIREQLTAPNGLLGTSPLVPAAGTDPAVEGRALGIRGRARQFGRFLTEEPGADDTFGQRVGREIIQGAVGRVIGALGDGAGGFERRTAPSAFGLPGGFVENFNRREDDREATFNRNRVFERSLDAREQSDLRREQGVESRFTRSLDATGEAARVATEGRQDAATVADARGRGRLTLSDTLARQRKADEERNPFAVIQREREGRLFEATLNKLQSDTGRQALSDENAAEDRRIKDEERFQVKQITTDAATGVTSGIQLNRDTNRLERVILPNAAGVENPPPRAGGSTVAITLRGIGDDLAKFQETNGTVSGFMDVHFSSIQALPPEEQKVFMQHFNNVLEREKVTEPTSFLRPGDTEFQFNRASGTRTPVTISN